MKLTFCGAAHEVTGSCHLLQTEKYKILVDCGMFQGSNFNEGKNHDVFPFDPKEIDVVLVTHAHLDHIGRIPKLIKDGFDGKIFMTKATVEFAELIWLDAFHVMVENHKRYGTPILFDETDIASAKQSCHGIDYHSKVEVLPEIFAVWKDAGHIFGSAFIEVEVKENSSAGAQSKKIAFSGDIGNEDEPIVRDTESLSADVDYLVCESTYGDRIHEHIDVRREVILNLIKEGVTKGGTIMVPAFSLERTQEFLYELNKLSEYDKTLPDFPIFLDSPLAIDATAVYKKYSEYYDNEAMRLHMVGDDFLDFPNLQMTHTVEESKKINHVPGPKMIIAGAGMMNGGRIVHHAFRYLPDPASTLLIVGYQAQGTLGRKLYEGAEKVKIFNEDVNVKCTVKALGALSAHGDQNKLLKWTGSGGNVLKKIYLVHGEPHAATELAHRLRDKYNFDVFVPEENEQINLE
ncbi:MAG: MBL fold metallo-hydrolase [Candidatus Magasanikiibacteriota bacterium]